LLLRSSGPELLQRLAEIEAKPELTPGGLCARYALAPITLPPTAEPVPEKMATKHRWDSHRTRLSHLQLPLLGSNQDSPDLLSGM
jgi:hypothetical protein